MADTDLDKDTQQGGEDDTAEVLNKLLSEMGFDDDDEPEAPAETPAEPKLDSVSATKGQAMVEQAQEERARDAAGRFRSAAGMEDDAAPKAEAEAPAEVEAKAADAEPKPTPTDLDALLDGLDDASKTSLRSRITEAEAVTGALSPYGDVLKAYGDAPRAQVERLAQIAAYATKNPQEYLAWAAEAVTGGKATEALAAVAERYGMKLVPVDPEPTDDPFEDPEVKKMREELRALRAQTRQQAPIGPDSPAWQAQAQERQAVDDLTRWKDEKGADGKPLRPLFDMLGPQIAERMQAVVKAQGRPANLQDLQAVYTELHGQVASAGGFAAQAPAPVAQPAKAQAAPQNSALDRAKAASKSIGGTGQGAPLRPAPSGSLDIKAALTEEWSRLGFDD